MRSKVLLLCLLVSLLGMAVFAGSYSISIQNAEQVIVSGNVYELSGNVILEFSTTEDSEDSVVRTLTAQTVKIDTDNKILQAAGDVVLKQNDDSFNGQTVVLDWDKLDVVVYNGTSASERNNAGGQAVKFYASGERISYAGGENTVFYSDGVISTKEKDPYWSVKASNIGLLESDLFFENATVRMGRVPVLWIPFFFYPGTKLAFNPSIGLNSSKGVFLNTTTEIYGAYPALGNSSSTQGQGLSEDDAAASILSFMASDEGELVRDGIIYKSIDDVELSDFEKDSREKGNYLAVFADVYEKYGPAIGYETKNKIGDLDFSSTAVLGYNKGQTETSEFRFATLNKATWNTKHLSFNLSLPAYSDPYSAMIYLNRNMTFDITSLLGSEQQFPTSYTSVNEYDWTLNANTSFKIGKVNFRVNSVTSDIEYRWNSKEKHFKVVRATLPYISISSSGSIYNWTGKGKSTSKSIGYSSDLASSFAEELEGLEKTDSPYSTAVSQLDGPSITLEKTKSFPAPYFNSSYTYKQTFSNQYLENMKPERLSTDASGSISVSTLLPFNSFSASLTTSPSYKYEDDKVHEKTKQSLLIPVSLKMGFPFIHVSYVISGNVLKANAVDSEWTNDKFDFTKDYITSHYLEASESVGNFKFALKTNLKPITESVVPSVSYSSNGFSVSSGVTLYLNSDGDSSKVNNGYLNTSFSRNKVSFGFNNAYDFSKEGWEGYSSNQSFSYSLSKKVSFSEKLYFKDKFKAQSMVLSAVLDKTNVSMSFSGEQFQKDTLSIATNFKVSPLYFWKNRIGLSANVNSKFTYDFQNVYGTSFVLDMSFDFAIKDFLTLGFSVKTANTSFYRYFTEDKFSFNMLLNDLGNSFAFFDPEKRRNTGFNLSSYTLNIVHNMVDWDLYVSASTSIITQNGNPSWNPQISVYMKWRAIPELKVENKWTDKSGWEK